MAYIILPFQAEYFRGGSTGVCKNQQCRKSFVKNALRIALAVQPSSLTGRVTFQWFHFECFFQNHEPECVGDIGYFESLSWIDQERITEAVKKCSASTNNAAIQNTSVVKENEIAENNSTTKNKFHIEYSISSRAKCRKCMELIKKNDIRVCKNHGAVQLWHHLDCFVEVRDELQFLSSGEKLHGIEALADDDKCKVKKAIPEILKKTSLPIDGIYTKIKNALPRIELDEEALKVKKLQNEQMCKYRDQLKGLLSPWSSSRWSSIEMLLKENGQDVPNGIDATLDRLADAMTFGALKRCPTCKKGQLEFRSGLSGMSYYCPEEDEWSRCASYFDEPPRDSFIVPKDMKKTGKLGLFLKEYEFVNIENRIFERNPPSASTIALNKGLKSKKTELVKTGISSTFVKLKVENGSAVDPQCRNAQKKSVYRDTKGNIYSASLTLTDLQAGTNSYCNIQVLVYNSSTGQRMYSFFQSWGEIGMPGSSKEDRFNCLLYAVEQFELVFEQQTGNPWKSRQTFKKVPGKKVLLDLSYGQIAVDEDDTAEKNSSNLEKSVQELVKMIFSCSLMNSAAKEMKLDLNKMPLGKLSRKQIQEAYKVLTELQEYISEHENEVEQKTVVALSNKFYSLIPHNFTTMDSLLLDTIPAIQNKLEMLDSLKEIEIAYSLMLKEKPDSPKSIIDLRYEELKTKLRPVNPTEPVYEILKRSLQKTHAQTHNLYTLDIIQIFEAEREGEDERYKRYETLHNKRLLWHGSRITNFAGILSLGLRIAPPGAPRSGLMFGKGIYFANMVSKAANYCQPHKDNDHTGLLLLCEVALGHMKHLFEADNVLHKPPRGFNSVKGIGRTEPNPFKTKNLYDDVTLASGRGVPSSVNPAFLPCTTLLYNEYIVYNVEQVKVKYLLQVKFNYNGK